MDDQSLYNQITVRNIDNEDFVFRVNREHYMIRAGETKVFMKLMVRPLLKHLIDRILIKRDPDGKLLRNAHLRDELAAQIVLKEETYERPHVISDRELVDQLNNQPELDRVLEKNKARIRSEDPAPVIPPPQIEMPKVDTKKLEKPEILVDEELFDQIEEEKNQPQIVLTRPQMLKYAKDVLKLDIDESKTKKAWDKMSDETLFKELGLDQEDLTELSL